MDDDMDDMDDDDELMYGDNVANSSSGDDSDGQIRPKRSEDILNFRAENDLVCRKFPVKETHKVIRSEDDNGTKMINQYVREYKIGSGSYG